MKRTLKFVAASAVIPFACVQAQNAIQHPNVLMLVVDDWGAHDLSLTGSKLYETKNIDHLAQESTNFSQAYVALSTKCTVTLFANNRSTLRPSAGRSQN